MIGRKLTEKQQRVQDERNDLVARAKRGDAEAQAELKRLHGGMRVYTPEEIRAFEKP